MIFVNMVDEGPAGRGYSDESTVISGPTPEQIKSVDNRGAFDESANIYNQDRNEPRARVYIEFSDNGTSIITLLKDADQSTFNHEMRHMMLGNFVAFGQTMDGTVQVRTDWQTAQLTAVLFVCAVPSIMGMSAM